MKLNNYLIYFFCIALGCVLGAFFCNYSYFEFDSKINIFELISLIVTTGFGIYISVKIGKVLNLENSEKSILIEEVKESIKITERINIAIERKSYDVRNIAAEVKLLNEHLYLLESLFQSSHCKDISLVDTRHDLRVFRKVTTGQSAVNNIITLDMANYRASKAAYRMLKHRYFKLILDINRK
jgi:hypothetical protein